MKKQAYQKPVMQFVLLQQQYQLLAGSLTQIQTTGLGSEEDSEEDELTIDETSHSGWGR